MGRLVHATLPNIEETLEGMRYGDLEMDDVADILIALIREVRAMKNEQARTANVASCLANGIQPD